MGFITFLIAWLLRDGFDCNLLFWLFLEIIELIFGSGLWVVIVDLFLIFFWLWALSWTIVLKSFFDGCDFVEFLLEKVSWFWLYSYIITKVIFLFFMYSFGMIIFMIGIKFFFIFCINNTLMIRAFFFFFIRFLIYYFFCLEMGSNV